MKAATDGVTDVKADSSTATDGVKTTADVLDAVLAASKSDGEPSPGSDKSGQETEPVAAADGAKQEKAADADEADEELPADVTNEKTRKSFDRLRGRLNQYRDLGSPEDLQRFKASHEHLDGVFGYMSKAGLSIEDVNAGFDVMRSMKNEPEKALPVLRTYVAQLEELLGEKLPDDLAEKVKQGFITEDDARELSRSKARASLSEKRATAVTEHASETEQQRQVADHRANCGRAVASWEQQQASKDPDWNAKVEDVMEKVELAFNRNGFPKTSADAVKMAQAALDAVNAKYKKFAPRRQEIAAPVESHSASDVRPKPKTTLEAIDAALGA